VCVCGGGVQLWGQGFERSSLVEMTWVRRMVLLTIGEEFRRMRIEGWETGWVVRWEESRYSNL
jgi:hypothetical protein